MGGEPSKPVPQPDGPVVASLAITTIDAVDIGDGRISFTKMIPGTKEDEDAHFLKEVVVVSELKGVKTYEAYTVEPKVFQDLVAAEAKQRGASHCLFYIHGFANSPEAAFSAATEANAYFEGKKAFMVPVIWPCGDTNIVNAYRADRNVVAPGAAKALSALTASLPPKPKTPFSLMAHSMGNFVLRNFAPAKPGGFQFENIFMVAADVDWEVFNEGQDPADGVSILSASKNKVHALFSDADKALLGRFVLNFGVAALGKRGFDSDKVVTSDKLVKKDAQGFDISYQGWNDRFVAHGYQVCPDALEYYLEHI